MLFHFQSATESEYFELWSFQDSRVLLLKERNQTLAWLAATLSITLSISTRKQDKWRGLTIASEFNHYLVGLVGRELAGLGGEATPYSGLYGEVYKRVPNFCRNDNVKHTKGCTL